MLPVVSVIVPARNEEAVIGKCLESLLASDYPKNKLEIIVAVDGCTDNTVKIAQKYPVKVVESDPKGCKAAALNTVWPSAKGDVIAIYDADSLVEKQTIKEATKHFSEKNVIGVSGMVKSSNKDNNFITKSMAIENCFSNYIELFVSKLGANAMFSGKNMFILKKVLEESGGFHEHAMVEDIELAARVRRLYRDYTVVFEPAAVAWQQEPPTFEAWFKQRYRWARGTFRAAKIIKNIKSEKPVKDFMADLMHTLPYLGSPFSIVVGSMVAAAVYMKLPVVVLLPLFALFTFNLALFLRSRFVMKEPLRDLAMMPMMFILDNIYTFVVLPKAWIDEKLDRPFGWYKTPRSTNFSIPV